MEFRAFTLPCDKRCESILTACESARIGGQVLETRRTRRCYRQRGTYLMTYHASGPPQVAAHDVIHLYTRRAAVCGVPVRPGATSNTGMCPDRGRLRHRRLSCHGKRLGEERRELGRGFSLCRGTEQGHHRVLRPSPLGCAWPGADGMWCESLPAHIVHPPPWQVFRFSFSLLRCRALIDRASPDSR
jgi:hypothetical protein